MTKPLDSYTYRPPTWDDAAAVARVIMLVNTAEVGEPDYAESDLRAEWSEARFDLGQKALLAVAPGGEIVGYAWWYDRKEHVDFDADVYVLPRVDWSALSSELLRRIETMVVAHAKAAPAHERVTLYVPTYEKVAAKHAVLAAADYMLRRYYFRMEIVLDGPPAVPEPPAGVTIRACNRNQDEATYYDVLTEAFHTHFRHSPMEQDDWIRRHAGDNEFYRPELWFLAEEAGRPIGAIVNMYYDDIGFVDELGVREAHRGRGLGKALLLRTFAALYAAGQPRVSLVVDAGNDTGATQLYVKAGMHQAHRVDLYEKVIREPA